MPLPLFERKRRLRMSSIASPHWTLKAQVQSRLEDLLDDKHVNNSEKRPPFTIAEMIVIAFVMSGKETLLVKDILCELLKTFKYYSQQAIDEYISARFYGEPVCLSDSPIPPGFYNGFDCSEAPLYSADSNEVITSESVLKEGCRINSPITGANIYLRTWLKNDCEQIPKQTKTFFDLPAEMRNYVYEKACTYAWPGLLVRPDGFRLVRRTMSEDMLGDEVETLRAPPVQALLDLLCVNKQMYSEALPIFYGRNWFSFDTPHEFGKFIKGSSDKRLGLLRQVIIGYDTTFRGLKGYEFGAKALSTFTTLQNLEVTVHDKTWFDREITRKCYGAEIYSKPHELPGIQNLAYALNNAARFKVFGDCLRIKRYLHTEVAKLKLAGTKGEVERLRRAEQLRQARSFKEIDDKRRSKDKSKDTTRSESGLGEKTTYPGASKSSKVSGMSNRSDCGSIYGERSLNKKSRSGYSASGRSDAGTSSEVRGTGMRIGERVLFDPELDDIEEFNARSTNSGKGSNYRSTAGAKRSNDRIADNNKRPSTRSTTSDAGSGGSEGRSSKRRKGNNGRY